MIGMIIAAGNQIRFENETLKCMMSYGNSDALTINIKTMLKCCREVIVVTNYENFETIVNHISKNFPYNLPNILPVTIRIERIQSGKECGHAVFTSIAKYADINEPLILKWGDAIHDSIEYYNVFNEVFNGDIFIPCEYVKNPYTSLICDGGIVHEILMRDEINTNTVGWHDLSIFYINNPHNFLMKVKYWMFIHPNIFLKSILEMDIIIRRLKTTLKSKSYNTIKEYNELHR